MSLPKLPVRPVVESPAKPAAKATDLLKLFQAMHPHEQSYALGWFCAVVDLHIRQRHDVHHALWASDQFKRAVRAAQEDYLRGGACYGKGDGI
jgi:hypothetical protein